MEKIVWQPELFGYDFRVYLDRDFAIKTIQTKIPKERQTRMNELGNAKLKELGTHWLDPYMFHGDSYFVSQVYIGNNGVWLATNYLTKNESSRKKSLEPIKYDSHNVDSSKDAYVLMALFGIWVEYADVICE